MFFFSKTKLSVSIAIVALLSTITQAQIKTTIPLPSQIKQGKLDNGLTYYILKNQKPKGKASFYFAQNVGAILEEDHEDGLAHFLEHMAFKGSKNFQESNGIDNFLQSKGFVLGDQYNAYTNWDQTLYFVEQVPAKDNAFIDQIMLMIHDWSGSLNLSEKDIDDERDIISGEWRELQSSSYTLQKKTWSALYNNSRYAERDVMGDVSFIKSFDSSLLRNFYKKWYRPDLQAIIIVGDIDVSAMEKKVKTFFSKIPKATNPKERFYVEIPENTKTQYLLATEKADDIIDVNMTFIFREKEPKIINENQLRSNFIKSLFSNMVSKRYKQVINKQNSPAQSIRVGYSKLTALDGANQISISPRSGQELNAVTAAFTELERVKRYGFLESELELAKKNLKVTFENRVDREKDKSNSFWANQLVSYFIEAKPVVSAKWHLEFLNNIFPTITTKEVNDYVNRFQNLNACTIIISGPEKDDIIYPSQKDILEAIKKARANTIEKFNDKLDAVLKKPLLSDKLPVEKIKDKFSIEGIRDAKGYILNNGVRVVLMPSKEKNSNISMQAVSPGGLASLKTKDLIFLDSAIELVQNSGLGDFNASDLSQKLSTQSARVSLSYRDFHDIVQGRGLVKDLESMLQLTYLYFEKPRFDKTVFENKKQDWKNDFKRYFVNTEKSDLYDAINILSSNGHPRSFPNKEEDFDAINFEQCKAIFKDRFSDADDFSFIFIGNFDTKKILPLIQQYLGNLSIKTTSEGFIDHKIESAKGISIREIEKDMQTPKTSISYNLINDNIDYTTENALIAQVIEAMLYTRFLSTLREDEGGTYGSQSYVTLTDIPKSELNVSVDLDAAPEKKENMIRFIKQELNNLANDETYSTDLENAKTYLLDNRKENQQSDFFWENEIVNVILFKRKHISFEDYKEKINAITLENIQDFAKKHILTSNVIQVTLKPKK
ncbi:insulinase family protein [Flavivirga abyssicola]|uniref:M16 family metallopeptidase n=1 Tax=Flavivirga abyssicola TaxID=3063533 RepID=UPI0026DF47A3|nr:M16 family metallopeptidase [Flavivirga sp. MEBiC07777]WVK14755.1 insulinase family protein [Flavivirga sp. MEBiC07777]